MGGGGVAPPLLMLFKGKTLRKGGGGIAPDDHAEGQFSLNAKKSKKVSKWVLGASRPLGAKSQKRVEKELKSLEKVSF